MTPLLESAVLTREDTKIWLNINLPMRRKAPNPLPSIAYFEADRRDAELMLFQMKLRDKLKPRGNYIRWMDLHPGADWRAECL